MNVNRIYKKKQKRGAKQREIEIATNKLKGAKQREIEIATKQLTSEKMRTLD